MFPCTLRKPHGFSVFEEDGGSLRATVTDSRNHRILDLEIDKGERCATVHRSVSAHTLPEWTVYNNPNDVETWVEGDAVHTLVSFKGSDPDTAEQGAAGRGKIVHLVWEEGAEPSIPWVFPPVDHSEPSFLSGQHNVDLVQTSGGDRLMLVAHSGGASERWHGDAEPGEEHGTVLLTSCCDEEPRYLFDATLTDTTLGYLRDVDLLEGGRALLTDSGCIEPEGCPVGAQLLEVPLPDLDAIDQLGLPERAGHWSADHAAQNLHEVQTEPWLLPQAWDDLGVSAYEADWVPAADLGERMRTLLEEGT